MSNRTTARTATSAPLSASPNPLRVAPGGRLLHHDDLVDQAKEPRRVVIARIWSVADDEFDRFIAETSDGLQEFVGTHPADLRVEPLRQRKQNLVRCAIEGAFVEDWRPRGVSNRAGKPGVALGRVDQRHMDATPSRA